MEQVGQLVVSAFFFELFPLFHHLALVGRRRIASRTGDPDAIKTTQIGLLRLQLIAVAITLAAIGVRFARQVDVLALGFPAYGLFIMVFAAGVYWRYPEAAPISLGETDWAASRFGGITRALCAVPTALFSLLLLGIVVAA